MIPQEYIPQPILPAIGNVIPHDHNGLNSPIIDKQANAPSRGVQCVVFSFTAGVSTGDGAFYFHIDQRLAGLTLTDVHAKVITAGTTGTTDIQIANVTNVTDLLTTKLTIDSGETDSSTAVTPAKITAANALVRLNDILRIDVDAVSTTAPKGLIVTLGFN